MLAVLHRDRSSSRQMARVKLTVTGYCTRQGCIHNFCTHPRGRPAPNSCLQHCGWQAPGASAGAGSAGQSATNSGRLLAHPALQDMLTLGGALDGAQQCSPHSSAPYHNDEHTSPASIGCQCYALTGQTSSGNKSLHHAAPSSFGAEIALFTLAHEAPPAGTSTPRFF